MSAAESAVFKRELKSRGWCHNQIVKDPRP